jgi:hypothetical protein
MKKTITLILAFAAMAACFYFAYSTGAAVLNVFGVVFLIFFFVECNSSKKPENDGGYPRGNLGHKLPTV